MLLECHYFVDPTLLPNPFFYAVPNNSVSILQGRLHEGWQRLRSIGGLINLPKNSKNTGISRMLAPSAMSYRRVVNART